MASPLRIWIDLENTPHVLFFEPVIASLRGLGHEVVVTARRFADTATLARTRLREVHVIGAGHDRGRSPALKRALFVVRTLQLWRFARGRRFDVAAGHVSRTQAKAAAKLGVPAWSSADYEHTYLEDLRDVRGFMVPDVVPIEAFERKGIPRAVIRPYSGLKEDVYLNGFRPAADARRVLGVANGELLVVFRPSADHAHYGSAENRVVDGQLLRRLASQERVRVIVLPRTAPQRRYYRRLVNGDGRVLIPATPLDAPSLIDAADLVVSGGGTMVREAAVLGVPAISCFVGPHGAVDRFLVGEGRLRVLAGLDDVAALEPVVRRPPRNPRRNGAPLYQIVDSICSIADASPPTVAAETRVLDGSRFVGL